MKSLFIPAFIFLFSGHIAGQQEDVLGGGYPLSHSTPCLTQAQRQTIEIRLQDQIAELIENEKIRQPFSRSLVQFIFPMEWNDGFDGYGFHGISNYVDHDGNFPSSVLDFNCGQRTYDTPGGYNHSGTDYFLWPFEWNLVQDDAVKAVAAAPGMIIGKDDGNDHHSCSFSSEDWNAVYLLHEDGSITWYGHLKKNSLTSKSVGQMVETGEYLGIVASSGNSSGPHLHFEVYDFGGSLIDPYTGDCNDLNAESWWLEQRPYIDPAINKIQTHEAPPEFFPCPQPAIPNESNVFVPGQQVYFVTYFRDQRNIDACEFSIVDPAGEVFDAWTFFAPGSFYYASYWYWTYFIPADALDGVWTFSCDFNGKTYSHEFFVENEMTSTDENDVSEKINVHLSDDILHVSGFFDIAADALLIVSDLSGRVLSRHQIQFEPGDNHLTIEGLKTQNGIYIVSVCSDVQGMGIKKVVSFK